jgi:threonine/homoserine/homoserine lactone efflux protein
MIWDIILGFDKTLVITFVLAAYLLMITPRTDFIFAFIPQFTDPEIGPIWLQILLLGTISLLNGLFFVVCLGAASGYFADALREWVKILNKLTAILFGGLAARLIID